MKDLGIGMMMIVAIAIFLVIVVIILFPVSEYVENYNQESTKVTSISNEKRNEHREYLIKRKRIKKGDFGAFQKNTKWQKPQKIKVNVGS